MGIQRVCRFPEPEVAVRSNRNTVDHSRIQPVQAGGVESEHAGGGDLADTAKNLRKPDITVRTGCQAGDAAAIGRQGILGNHSGRGYLADIVVSELPKPDVAVRADRDSRRPGACRDAVAVFGENSIRSDLADLVPKNFRKPDRAGLIAGDPSRHHSGRHAGAFGRIEGRTDQTRRRRIGTVAIADCGRAVGRGRESHGEDIIMFFTAEKPDLLPCPPAVGDHGSA